MLGSIYNSDNTLVHRTNESLLLNAKDALTVGFEDYVNNKSTNARIKSSIRNIYAGIELLLKRYINTFSPVDSHNILLYRDSDYIINEESGSVIAVGDESSHTIGFTEIIKRIKKYTPQDISKDLLKRISNIKDKRNQIEHSTSSEPRHILKFSILDSFEIIKELDEIFKTKIHTEVISEDIRNDFDRRLKNYQGIKEGYPESFKSEQTKYIICTVCNSFMVKPASDDDKKICDREIECIDCGHKFVISSLLIELSSSSRYPITHNNLKPLENMHEKVFHLLSKEQILAVANSCITNNQIKGISRDPDVHDFIIKIYNALRNCEKFKIDPELQAVRKELLQYYL